MPGFPKPLKLWILQSQGIAGAFHAQFAKSVFEQLGAQQGPEPLEPGCGATTVCPHVYIYIYIHTYTYSCVYVFICIYVHTHTSA